MWEELALEEAKGFVVGWTHEALHVEHREGSRMPEKQYRNTITNLEPDVPRPEAASDNNVIHTPQAAELIERGLPELEATELGLPELATRPEPASPPVAAKGRMVFGCMRPLSRVIQLQHGCPSQRKGANTAIEARLQVLSDVGLPPTTATKRSRRAGYYTNETRLHRVLKPCGLQQQQTASTGLSVFELRRGDALAPLYALAKCF